MLTHGARAMVRHRTPDDIKSSVLPIWKKKLFPEWNYTDGDGYAFAIYLNSDNTSQSQAGATACCDVHYPPASFSTFWVWDSVVHDIILPWNTLEILFSFHEYASVSHPWSAIVIPVHAEPSIFKPTLSQLTLWIFPPTFLLKHGNFPSPGVVLSPSSCVWIHSWHLASLTAHAHTCNPSWSPVTPLHHPPAIVLSSLPALYVPASLLCTTENTFRLVHTHYSSLQAMFTLLLEQDFKT